MLGCNKNRHSAKCTNADDLFDAYILSFHLVSHALADPEGVAGVATPP